MKYRKKTDFKEAEKYTGNHVEISKQFPDISFVINEDNSLTIKNYGCGNSVVMPGDYILRVGPGLFAPATAKWFEENYESAE